MEAPRSSAPPAKPHVRIDYCAKCRFLPRAAWLAQELLTTFADELGALTLVPGDGGVFQVRVASAAAPEELELVACRVRDGGFPELAELKRRIRDRIAPGRELGHSERA
jgi:selenoprotein W-related protein